MRFLLAVFFCRALYFAGGIFHRGSAKPGEWALKLCPDALARLKFDGKVICVTGTNGKTTTANLIAHILRESGHTAINNAKGSNMLGGVATLLLNRCTLGRRVKADYVVLEVDERYMRLLVRSVHPDYFLVNNLLRDQIARNCCPEIVFDKMKPAIVPGTTQPFQTAAGRTRRRSIAFACSTQVEECWSKSAQKTLTMENTKMIRSTAGGPSAASSPKWRRAGSQKPSPATRSPRWRQQ